jgi:probable F420-dependent oxidoreductase
VPCGQRYLSAVSTKQQNARRYPIGRRVLDALGPKMLKLSAERAAGAHPYLSTPEHTRKARQMLGSEVLLAPEQKVVLDTDPVRARAIGRPVVAKPYLGLVDYTSNLRSLGYTEPIWSTAEATA